MLCSHWSERKVVGKTYLRARDGEGRLWANVHSVLVRDLRKWLVRRNPSELPAWEIDEVCEEAFFEVFRNSAKLSNWPVLWVYACKVAFTKARRRARRRNQRQVYGRGEGRSVGAEAASTIDLHEDIETVVATLGRRGKKLILVIRSIIREEQIVSITRIARRLKVSRKVVRKELRAIRRSFRRRLAMK